MDVNAAGLAAADQALAEMREALLKDRALIAVIGTLVAVSENPEEFTALAAKSKSAAGIVGMLAMTKFAEIICDLPQGESNE